MIKDQEMKFYCTDDHKDSIVYKYSGNAKKEKDGSFIPFGEGHAVITQGR